MSGIDDIFKNGLQDKGLEYKEAYWDNMQQMIDGKKRRKKGGFFFLTSIGMLLLGVWIGYMLFHQEYMAPAPQKHEQKLAADAEPFNKGNARIITETNNDEKAAPSSPENNNTLAGDNVILTPAARGIPLKNIEPPVASSTIYPKNGNAVTEYTNTNITADEPLQIGMPAANTREMPEDIGELGFCRLFAIPVIIKKNFDLSMIDLKPFSFATVKKDVTVPPSKSEWGYFISAGYEYDQYSRAKNTSLLKAEESTRNSGGFNLNFAAGKNNWRIRSGLGFLQFSEITNYTSYNHSSTYDTSYHMVDPDFGQTPAGTRIALIKQQVDSTVTNTAVINHPDSRVQFSYIKIPLIASYEFGFGKFGFTVDAGINSSFLIRAGGNYTVYNGSEYQVRDIRKNDLNKILLQTYAAAGLRYHFNKQISICGGYGWSHSLNSMTKSYTQKPRINLLTIGLEFRLN